MHEGFVTQAVERLPPPDPRGQRRAAEQPGTAQILQDEEVAGLVAGFLRAGEGRLGTADFLLESSLVIGQ
ncbi:hypothetical protein D3C78_1890450 [compost metagenome]